MIDTRVVSWPPCWEAVEVIAAPSLPTRTPTSSAANTLACAFFAAELQSYQADRTAFRSQYL